MIEEIMLAFGSPGIISIRLIVPLADCKLLPGKFSELRKCEAAAKDRVRRLTCHGYLSLSSAPCWLATEFVWATVPAAASLGA